MVAREAGTFLGGFFNNPGLVAIALGIGALLVFRKPITEAFANFKLPSINLPDVNFGDFKFPDIKFPDFNIQFPTFEAPTFDFGNLFNQILNPGEPGREEGSIEEQVEEGVIDVIPDVTGGRGDRLRGDQTMEKVNELVQRFLPEGFNTERTSVSFGTEIIVPPGDELNLGGGLSFIGGTTTFGDNLVDTLSEVLNIFPNLSASQARDALEENQGLTGSQFRLINPDVINLSSEGIDQPQILLNASGGFTGLTPEQIAKLLTGGNISNF